MAKYFLALLLFSFVSFESHANVDPELLVQRGHSNEIHALAFSPDQKLLATSSTGELRIIDVSTMRVLRTMVHDDGSEGVSSMVGSKHIEFSPDGKWLLSTGRGSSA